jgi:hypothetical protein
VEIPLLALVVKEFVQLVPQYPSRPDYRMELIVYATLAMHGVLVLWFSYTLFNAFAAYQREAI